jgi:hypothetical protein
VVESGSRTPGSPLRRVERLEFVFRDRSQLPVAEATTVSRSMISYRPEEIFVVLPTGLPVGLRGPFDVRDSELVESYPVGCGDMGFFYLPGLFFSRFGDALKRTGVDRAPNVAGDLLRFRFAIDVAIEFRVEAEPIARTAAAGSV